MNRIILKQLGTSNLRSFIPLRHLLPLGERMTTQQCGIATATSIRCAKEIMKVPTMGDSITEGTIVEWTVSVGQAVKEGDVVALVETDKVTVDIKASIDGVITQKFGAVDETIEVGANLYEIDTEATSTLPHPPLEASTAAPPSDTITTTIPEDVSFQQITEFSITSSVRVPSIRFYGKEGWSHRLNGVSQSEESLPVEPPIPTKPHGVVVLDGSMINARYGRPDLTEDEMEALMLGGADMAPSSWNPSSNST